MAPTLIARRLRSIPAITLAVAAVMPGVVQAAALTPTNILVANLGSGMLREYTPAGSVVQSFTFPDFAGGFHDLRDVVVSADGRVQAYNGTFAPQMSTLTPATGAFSNQTLAGWSTINNISFGGIAAFGISVFATDMSTAGGAESGIVRFSTAGAAATRFASGKEYDDLTVGGDGLLYASQHGAIDVYNPTTNALVRSFALADPILSGDIRGIAVAANGNVYAAGWNGSVYAATPNGTLINSRAIGVGNLMDIDINDAGTLLVSAYDRIVLTDTSLASQTSFTWANGSTLHAAFAAPLTVPEPAALGLLAGVGTLLARRRR